MGKINSHNFNYLQVAIEFSGSPWRTSPTRCLHKFTESAAPSPPRVIFLDVSDQRRKRGAETINLGPGTVFPETYELQPVYPSGRDGV